MKSVVVFGSSRAKVGSREYTRAVELGAALAHRAAEVRCGGYGGLMEAVSRGAREAGGRAVGCTLSWAGESRAPNGWLSEVVPSPSLGARMEELLRGTSAAIALHGGVGTLNEFFWVWTLLLHGVEAERNLVLLGDPFRDLVDFLAKHFEVDDAVRGLLHHAATAEEAVDLALGRRQGR
jgi:uncharacterized protein (TIGR00725 family)